MDELILNMKIVSKEPSDFHIDNEYKLEGKIGSKSVKATVYAGDMELEGTVDVSYTHVIDGVLQDVKLKEKYPF